MPGGAPQRLPASWQRRRKETSPHDAKIADPPERVTISVGVAACRAGAGIEPETLVGEADSGLYAAKHGGRNRVRLASVEAYASPLRHFASA